MIDIAMENIPQTGGRYYDYIEFEDFINARQHNKHINFEVLVPGTQVTFYRIAKSIPENDRPEEIVFLKLSGEVISRNHNTILLLHSGTKGKMINLEGIGEFGTTWFFEIND